MKPFVINRQGRLVLPFNFFPELDFSVFDTLEQFSAVIRRDFEEKAPTEADIVARIAAGAYKRRYDLLRDLALDLFWVNRYTLTMYERVPTRWRDVPRFRQDVFLPVYTVWDSAELSRAIEDGYAALPPAWDDGLESKIFRILLGVFRHKPGAGRELPAIKPTVGEAVADPRSLTVTVRDYEPDAPRYEYEDIIEYTHSVPELEALARQAMILHNEYSWRSGETALVAVGALQDDDLVITFRPRSPAVLEFIRRVKGSRRVKPARPVAEPAERPMAPMPPVIVRDRFTVMPRLESLAAVKGERVCTNDDLIRNTAYCWSPMSAEEIFEKTGIAERCYTELDLEHLALLASRRALAGAQRRPAEIGAVLFCSCTSTRLIPSVATWLSGKLGIFQTHASCDIVAACAGMAYGMAEAVRLLQEVERPVLLVCAEKFSDKIGTVRTSRMIFGDGAAAMVVAPAPGGGAPDIEVLQTYASGPMVEVDSIIWPNPEFDNNITVYGPEVRKLAGRYLTQMIGELRDLPRPEGEDGSLLDAIDLVVPHQANKTMVVELARAAGIEPERLYFDIEKVGNTSAASIPIAMADAVRDGVIDGSRRIFAPGFGAGAVGGYVVMRLDPAIVTADA